MKKLIVAFLSLFSLGSLTSCNMNIGLGTYNFRKIHCITTNECYTISSWKDYEMGIEVRTKEYGSLYFSEGTYILVEDECPICEG